MHQISVVASKKLQYLPPASFFHGESVHHGHFIKGQGLLLPSDSWWRFSRPFGSPLTKGWILLLPDLCSPNSCQWHPASVQVLAPLATLPWCSSITLEAISRVPHAPWCTYLGYTHSDPCCFYLRVSSLWPGMCVRRPSLNRDFSAQSKWADH